jgi:hypothetical protein
LRTDLPRSAIAHPSAFPAEGAWSAAFIAERYSFTRSVAAAKGVAWLVCEQARWKVLDI